MQYPIEQHSFSGFAATQGPFSLFGGQYAVTMHAATWASGSVTVQRQAADGATMVTVMPAFTSDGYSTQYLPKGTYQLTLTAASGVFADVTSITVNK